MSNNSEPFSDEVAGPDCEEIPLETVSPYDTPALDGEVIEPGPTEDKIEAGAAPDSCTVTSRLETRSCSVTEIIEDAPDRTRRLRLQRDLHTVIAIKAEMTRW